MYLLTASFSTMPLKIICFLLFILRGPFSFAQNPTSDSLTVWLQQSEQFAKADNGVESLVFAEKALRLAEKTGNKATIGWANRHVGRAHFVAGQDEKAAAAYEFSLANNDGRAETLTRLTAEYARVLHHEKRTVEASELYLKALNMYTTQLSAVEANRNLDVKSLILERMAVILSNQKQYEQAESYALEAYDICDKLGDKSRLQITATALGNVYYWKKNYKKAAFYYQSAYDFSKSLGRPSGRPLNNLGIVYTLDKQYEKSIETYHKAIEVYKKQNAKELIAQVYINIGSAYNLSERYPEAIENVERGIQQLKDMNSTAGLLEAYEEMVSIHTHKNDFKSALSYQTKMTTLTDSLAANSRQTELTQLQARFESAKKEGDIKNLRSEKALQDLTFQRQQLDLTNQKLISERNISALKAAEMEQDFQELELQKTAAELKEIEQVKDLQSAQLIVNQKDAQFREQQIVEQSKNLNLLRGALILSLLLAMALWQLFRYRQRAELAKKKLENERLQNETHRSLIEMKAEALRSQMNPHFIFNSLNTIEGFMLQNRTMEASTFLQKFSKLIRLVLENSRHSTISLEQDVEVLKLYVQLESIRYEGTFTYEFDVDDFILEQKIPPTLIQPFIENAILHGLRNRNKSATQPQGFLKITIEEVQNVLVIRVEDNGIGRENAQKIKQNNVILGKTSIGMDNTAERIRLFSADSTLTITDLNPTDADGNVGTRVEIKFPNP
jgi:tetratricopeptide (TPR) repeat protein/type II secretory pathway pseudopilin PulG